MPRGTDIHGRPPLLWRALEGGEVRGRDWEERIEGEIVPTWAYGVLHGIQQTGQLCAES